jgi:hypothetical protein
MSIAQYVSKSKTCKANHIDDIYVIIFKFHNSIPYNWKNHKS